MNVSVDVDVDGTQFQGLQVTTLWMQLKFQYLQTLPVVDIGVYQSTSRSNILILILCYGQYLNSTLFHHNFSKKNCSWLHVIPRWIHLKKITQNTCSSLNLRSNSHFKYYNKTNICQIILCKLNYKLCSTDILYSIFSANITRIQIYHLPAFLHKVYLDFTCYANI